MPTPDPPRAGGRPESRAGGRPDARAGERIAKLLARAGIASRREVERMIADGRIARDGVAIDTPATLLTSLDGVTVDGKPVAAPAEARLFIYHKPPGLLVTERDPAGRATIYDRLPPELPRVVPVGRLDLATEGLLLLTTDGGLKRQLELPATGVERTYRARAYGPISQARLEELVDGIEIDGIRYGSIDANLERRTGANTWIEMTLTEGKNREVRRVLEHLGLEVSRLIRVRYGPFVLGDMAPGDVGEVRQHDLEIFRKTLKGGKPAGAEQPVLARPLAAPVPAVAAGTAARASDRPQTPGATPRTGRGDRRTATASRESRARSGPARTAIADAARPARAPSPGGVREATPRPAPSADARAAAGPDRRRARAAAFAAERDQRPRSFGNRTRAVTAARSSRAQPGDRPSESRTEGAGRKQRGERDGQERDKAPPRATGPRPPTKGRPPRGKPSGPRPPSGRPTGPRGKR